jgi:hypothetical protein
MMDPGQKILSLPSREFLVHAMALVPSDSAGPDHIQPEDFVKYYLPGLEAAGPRNEWLLASKCGQAYGFSSDLALITHRSSGNSAILAATLYTNANGIINDDIYEYETVARPFFKTLAAAVAQDLQTL